MTNVQNLCSECRSTLVNNNFAIKLYDGAGRRSCRTVYFCGDTCKHKYATTKICKKCSRYEELRQVRDSNGDTYMLCNWYGKSPTCYEEHIGKICNEMCDLCRETCGDMNYINMDITEGNNYIQYYYICDKCYNVLLKIILERKRAYNENSCVFCKGKPYSRELRVPLCDLCKKIYEDVVCIELV